MVSPGSARIVHVQSALLPYSKGKWGLEMIPLCPRKVPPQASSAGNRMQVLRFCWNAQSSTSKKSKPEFKAKLYKPQCFCRGAFYCTLWRDKDVKGCKILSGQAVPPDKCQLTPCCTLPSDLSGLISNTPRDRASAAAVGGGSQHNTSRCRDAIFSHVVAWVFCCIPYSSLGSSEVFSTGFLVASQAGGKPPGIQCLQSVSQTCENSPVTAGREVGFQLTQISPPSSATETPPRAGTTGTNTVFNKNLNRSGVSHTPALHVCLRSDFFRKCMLLPESQW